MQAQPYRNQRKDPAVEAAVNQHGTAPSAALPVLRSVQDEQGGFITPEQLGAVAEALHISDARAYGLASFYALLSTRPRSENTIRVCDGPQCRLAGADRVRSAIEAMVSTRTGAVERCSCLGLCDRAPAALYGWQPCGPIFPDRANVLDGIRASEVPGYVQPLPGEVRVSMARIGRFDPDSLDSALQAGAYRSLATALAGPPETILDLIDRSGLRGYGGAGFPTGRKWRAVAQSAGLPKYVVCNADESEPGTFKDRVLLTGDPHLLLEGMALAGYAVGAHEGIIYIRGEYEWLARRLTAAITQAEHRGWLGSSIQGTPFSFRVHVHRGAGAYICGEETALLESLEGKRGEPRCRPPYPTTYGYRGRPTLVNNVETLCQIPPIVAHGADWFRLMGTPSSPGTKIFTVTGCINRPGAFEVPFGITLRQIIAQFGGGLRAGRRFKAVLAGGAAGIFVPESLVDVPIDFSSVQQGVPLGSGAMLVIDDSVTLPTVLSWVLQFFEAETCGKCTPCREGTREARRVVERIAMGRGRPGDLDELRRLARFMNATSLCGLGQSTAWPVLSALDHFEQEFVPGRGQPSAEGQDQCRT